MLHSHIFYSSPEGTNQILDVQRAFKSYVAYAGWDMVGDILLFATCNLTNRCNLAYTLDLYIASNIISNRCRTVKHAT